MTAEERASLRADTDKIAAAWKAAFHDDRSLVDGLTFPYQGADLILAERDALLDALDATEAERANLELSRDRDIKNVKAHFDENNRLRASLAQAEARVKELEGEG